MPLRRDFLLTATRTAAVIALPTWAGGVSAQTATAQNAAPWRLEAIARWRRRIEAILAKGKLPIIDMEATYVPDVTQVEKMVARMDELDIAQIVFAPANVPNAQPSLALY